MSRGRRHILCFCFFSFLATRRTTRAATAATATAMATATSNGCPPNGFQDLLADGHSFQLHPALLKVGSMSCASRSYLSGTLTKLETSFTSGSYDFAPRKREDVLGLSAVTVLAAENASQPADILPSKSLGKAFDVEPQKSLIHPFSTQGGVSSTCRDIPREHLCIACPQVTPIKHATQLITAW